MITVQEYLREHGCDEDLGRLISLIADQADPIRGAFIANQSYATTLNSSGEVQAELDAWADDHLIRVMKESGLVSRIASEEQDEVVECPESCSDYTVVMDPLDGSSLIAVNLAVGSIFGIYKGPVLQRGRDLAAALYLLYGPMTTLTLSIGSGVATFALADDGRFLLMEDGIRMPEGSIYGSGGTRPEWTEKHTAFITSIEDDGGKVRYSGSFVADFHQILKYGGLYAYPAARGKPEGKLRLVFEAQPIGFLAMQAGGRISDGFTDTLDILPTDVHQKIPIYVGSRGLIERLESMGE
ncbi:fructose-1,6-bisphosphatase I [Methanocalculus alkaliphilus]|uniref:class 1 fructose-bisphosphatase n=1 Tax=Methanocalculus alkaliphilus TaxID=768730 RepID=UPI00209E3C75|nr:class 1 fructose-bisphosphatase [Methanocalculus alkaliphilus]MCP1715099.1 fructose-1,6-bisphosphatase I [Methanocalculus alkaliphilus]